MWEPLINQSQLSIQILTLEIHSFKPLRYTCECNNWYKLWKSTKLEIFRAWNFVGPEIYERMDIYEEKNCPHEYF